MNIQHFYHQQLAKKPTTIRIFNLLLGLLLWTTAQSQQIFINEFMASNSSTIADELGVFEDWVELYNAGTSPVNIGGMYLSDNPANPTLWQVPSTNPAVTTIPAGGFLLLWFDNEPAQGPLHINAKLGASGESIILTAANGTTTINSYTFGPQIANVSEGRIGDGNANFGFFAQPTPGASNNTTPGAPITPSPTVNNSGGFYNNSVTVTISGAGNKYYTTDGSVPTTSSTLYTAPLTFTQNTPLRIVAFNPPALPSKTITHTYLFNVNTEFAVVSYVADPVELFDPATGMYPNYEDEIEIEANAEMWEPNGTQGFNILFESEIHGTGSAVFAQKPLALKAKASLGAEKIAYNLFPDQPGYEPRSLVLRNSGQDWNITMFRDAFVSSLVRDLSDVGTTITKPKLYTQGFRPGIAFINGEFWGIHNIRERMDSRYLKAHFDLDPTEVDFLENESEIQEGDFTEWNVLRDYLTANSLANQVNLNYVAGKVDLDHYLDYVIFNLYIDNQDWPGNNNKRWRERVPDAKWRFMTWDLDFSYGLYIPGQPYNSGIATSNSLSRMYVVPNYLWPNPEWSTLLFRRLMENDGMRTKFINRMADQLNVLYTPSRVNARIDQFVATYDSEIQAHHDRWTSGYQVWAANVQKLRNFANERIAPVRTHFDQQYSEITGTGNITVNLNSAANGSVILNTITVSSANAPFTGVYFRGVDVPVRAKPKRGYVLQSWSGGGLSGASTNAIIDFNNNTSITANFALGSTATQPIVINEINYNSPSANNSGDWIELHNPNSSAVNISGWYFEDESGEYFSIPANTTIAAGAYLVLVENVAQFNTVYPSVTNYIGAFGLDPGGFALSNGGEQITIKNANGALIDNVTYDDANPWPTTADGNGPTLQLISATLNNALASSWEAKIATPGLANNTPCIDNDNDGVCVANDCNDNNPAVPAAPGTACNDGNSNTTNDVIQADGCTCAGTVPQGGDCNAIVITATANSISIGNINAPHYIIKLFTPTWSTVINCVDCAVPQVANNLAAGTYNVDVKLLNANWQPICTRTQTVVIGGGGCPVDADNDGVCSTADCNDNNPAIPATPGTPCNDANPNTTGDVIQQDGCTCSGIPSSTGNCDDIVITTTSNSVSIGNITAGHYIIKLFSPTWSTVINCTDCAVPQVATGLAAGTYHADVQLYTASWQFICKLTEDVQVGGAPCTDNDNDGICVPADCNDNNPNLPATPGTACNDNNANTTNDVIQANGCTCAGTPVSSTGIALGCGVSYTATNTSITITGLSTTAHASFALFNNNWQTISTCFDNCADPLVFNNLPTAKYILRMNVWNASWARICDVTKIIDLANPNNLTTQNDEADLYFHAVEHGRSVLLGWVTTNSEPTEHFVVEKSLDGNVFEELIRMQPQEEQNPEMYYQAQDKDVVVGANYYRLRQVLKDGSERMSNTHTLIFDVDVETFALFPNPADDKLYVNLKAQSGAAADLSVFNQLGQKVYSMNIDELQEEPLLIDLANLKSGMYHLAVKIEGERMMTKRFIIAR